MKDLIHLDKILGRSNSPLLTFLMGIMLLVSGSCKEEETVPSSQLQFTASGPAASAANPAVATVDNPVDISWTQHSSYLDSNGSTVDCDPRADFHLSVSKKTVRANSIEELLVMKEASSQDKSGSAPVKHQMKQTFQIGDQTVSFDMSYEVYSYKNAHGETFDMPYVKVNPVRYGEVKHTENTDGKTRSLASVTGVRIRPKNLTRGSINIEHLYDVTVSFNMDTETVGETQKTKKNYSFEVNYEAWVESVFEYPDPETTFGYTFGVVGGTESEKSPFVLKNSGEKMELEWKGQSRHTWFDVSVMEQKLFSDESFARVDISLENDTISKYDVSSLDDMLGYTVSEPTHSQDGNVTKGTWQMKLTPLDKKLKQQTIKINWSYNNGSTAQTSYGDVAMPYLVLGDPELMSLETSPLESGVLPDGLNGYEIRVRMRQTFSTVNEETPHSEVVEYMVRYIIVEDIFLQYVQYRKECEWIERTDTTAMAFCPVVYRDRIYNNGEVFTDTFIDEPQYVCWNAIVGPSQYTEGGGTWRWLNQKKAIYQACEYDNKDKTFKTSVVVGVPSITNVTYSIVSDGYTTPYAGTWDLYELHRYYGPDTKIPEGIEVIGSYEAANPEQTTGWYLLKPEYFRQVCLYSKDSSTPKEPFLELSLSSNFTDLYLIIDGIKMSYMEGRTPLTLKFTEERTTYDGKYRAKRYTHKGLTTYFDRQFEGTAEAIVYQLPSGATRAADDAADIQQSRSAVPQQRSQRCNALPVPYRSTPTFIYGGKPKGVKGRY